MKPYKSMSILGVILLLFAAPLHAQDVETTRVFSLEEIWKIAETNNRQLKLSDLNLQQSKLEVLEAKDRLLPELSIGGDVKANSKFLIYDNGLFSSPQDVPVKGYGYGAGYNLNFTLFNGGKEKRNVRMKQEEETRRQYEVDRQKHGVKYNVADAYFGLYKLLNFRDFLAAEIAAERKQLLLIESLHRNGIVLKSDVLRTSVKLSQLELSLSDIEKKIDITKQRLNILMGRNNEEELNITYRSGFETDSNAGAGYADYVDIALNQSPEYKMVASDLRLSEMNIRQIKAALLPKVSLYSNYNYTYPQLSFYPYSNDLWGFGQTGIKVQFSIDNLYKSRHSIARAQVVNDQAKEMANIKRDAISIQVKEAFLQQQQALESVETAEKNITKTTEAVRVIRNSYLNQESLLTDLLEAENALLEAKFNLATAQTNLKLSHIQLLAIVGIL
ncbi:TolC family protein [Chitinophaga ginsengisoli]|uniref:Outer membrane protein TolC n=1 Tax=Chitinophaga ginsengisoli TaxID=363837 RepID=A0A2P8G586_9BACT|nr:TolC family protein [Chitinophaga ginsengisoli]PSL29129.1 outer membrane protein TolC [Chitinophaga ginsengisoli]